MISIAMSNAYWLGSFHFKNQSMMAPSKTWSFKNLRPVLDTFFFAWERSTHSLAVGDSDLKEDPNVANCCKNGCKMFRKMVGLIACAFGHRQPSNRSSDSAFLTEPKVVDHWLPDCKVNNFCEISWSSNPGIQNTSRNLQELPPYPTVQNKLLQFDPRKFHEISHKSKAWWLVGLNKSNIYHLTVHYQRWNLLSFPALADLHIKCDLTEHLAANSFWMDAWCCSLMTSFI